MDLQKLYNDSISFRVYVDRTCKMYGKTKAQAFEDAIVKSYAEYILNGEQPEIAKERRYESKQDAGC